MAAEDVPLFDPPPQERKLVPVDGWPDYYAERKKRTAKTSRKDTKPDGKQ